MRNVLFMQILLPLVYTLSKNIHDTHSANINQILYCILPIPRPGILESSFAVFERCVCTYLLAPRRHSAAASLPGHKWRLKSCQGLSERSSKLPSQSTLSFEMDAMGFLHYLIE
jgi:hypothetical protein